MRILAAIPHYFDPQSNAKHGSLRRDPLGRIRGLAAALSGLKQFAQPVFMLHHDPDTHPVRLEHQAIVDIIICITGARHLLEQLPVPAGVYAHRATQCDPRLLGFECQLALRERAGAYDYYCFLEDDIVIHDPSFFEKLAWFTKLAGGMALLQPNRYEAEIGGRIQKLYIDGDLPARATKPFQNMDDRPEITGDTLGSSVSFRRTRNPHAGCYFLDSGQFTHWIQQPHFAERRTDFIGPLESAATVGIARTFRVYKPAAPNLAFLEVQHNGAEIIAKVEQAMV